MNEETTRSSIVSDLVKIDKYRSHLADPDKFFLQDSYADHSMDDLKRIHDIYTRYLLEYRNLGEPYPSVIESLEYTNQGIKVCISDHKGKVKE
jgi:hypothetical protein